MKNKMKNKMKNNEKLAHNTIRARKALKKRSDEKTTQTRRKRWQSRLFALVGCILLVSALVVPCFADWEPSTEKYVDGFDVEIVYGATSQRVDVSLMGYYELRLTSLDYSATNPFVNTFIDVPDHIQAYFSFTDGRDDNFYQFTQVNYGDDLAFGMVQVYIVDDLQNGTLTDIILPVTSFAFYIPAYPDSTVLLEAVFSAPGTNYTVSQLVYPFTPDKVTTIWTDVISWITNALASIQSVFYLNGSLTFLGTLAVIGVSIALGWLIIGVVTRFFQLRG